MSEKFELPAEITIYNVSPTREALLAWLQKTRPKSRKTLEISAKAVTQVDAAGLQLLASFANMQRRWKLVEASDAFTEACETMGLTRWLGRTTAPLKEVSA